MKTDTTDSSNPTTRTNLSPTRIFSLLADDRRRHTMRYLARTVGAVAIGEVAEEIALREGDLTRDRYERVVTGLFHTHVPLLSEAGLIRYDPEREVVTRLPAADQLSPYLELSAAADLR